MKKLENIHQKRNVREMWGISVKSWIFLFCFGGREGFNLRFLHD
jgi:hypothetical protein